MRVSEKKERERGCGGCNGLVCVLGDICLTLDLANHNLPMLCYARLLLFWLNMLCYYMCFNFQ